MDLQDIHEIVRDDISDSYQNIRERLVTVWSDLEIFNWCAKKFVSRIGVHHGDRRVRLGAPPGEQEGHAAVWGGGHHDGKAAQV